jgi:hypothetical protein
MLNKLNPLPRARFTMQKNVQRSLIWKVKYLHLKWKICMIYDIFRMWRFESKFPWKNKSLLHVFYLISGTLPFKYRFSVSMEIWKSWVIIKTFLKKSFQNAMKINSQTFHNTLSIQNMAAWVFYLDLLILCIPILLEFVICSKFTKFFQKFKFF